ncbi:hypothetical protein [Paraburkholderia tropica]|uniref:hypothetical protein n=1 Tax=Paraburkholderia tropica TaxID=92647 RepID=UPI002ABDA0D7|nr:hypothetical protein [Paraburkholderia tropica]
MDKIAEYRATEMMKLRTALRAMPDGDALDRLGRMEDWMRYELEHGKGLPSGQVPFAGGPFDPRPTHELTRIRREHGRDWLARFRAGEV